MVWLPGRIYSISVYIIEGEGKRTYTRSHETFCRSLDDMLDLILIKKKFTNLSSKDGAKIGSTLIGLTSIIVDRDTIDDWGLI